ncbi:fimbrial protein [Metapseudomonas boanensis]|uniref:Type 1 fimbrial protein n=1 Tax=Metapseudomonas boanensis TaxID=2822138 RepID=A0ABS5XNR0_9GAMM|nr:fimbrial protein [Pseudomonas boanensis]MBT8769303.1 type 1 fimbrial protein [Pseudomonas boanensis]
MALIGGCVFTAALSADDILLSFDGTLVVPACELVVENTEQVVNLGIFNKRDLETVPRTPAVPFHIDILTCSEATKVSVLFKGKEEALLPGSLALEGEASGVAIGLETSAGDAIKLNVDNLEYAVTGGEKKRLSFSAHLRPLKGKTIGPGAFNAVTNFEISYP